jgi:hypothetical protein
MRFGRYKLVVFGDVIMKVHSYIIEVMWVMLAVLGSWIYAAKLGVLFNNLIMQRNLQNKPPFTHLIRPPPLINWSCQKSLTVKKLIYEPVGHKKSAYGLLYYLIGV